MTSMRLRPIDFEANEWCALRAAPAGEFRPRMWRRDAATTAAGTLRGGVVTEFAAEIRTACWRGFSAIQGIY